MTPIDRERRTEEQVRHILAAGTASGTAVFSSMVSRIMGVVREDREAAIRRERQAFDAFRRNVARHLAPGYIENPTQVARLCNEHLDPSGALLGAVREAAVEAGRTTDVGAQTDG